MDMLITPKPLAGVLVAPPSKSVLHRALICAAFSDKPTRITSQSGFDSISEDIAATIRCLNALGAHVSAEHGALVVEPLPRALLENPAELSETVPLLDCGMSGTTLRFLLPPATLLYPQVTFTGSKQLAARPINDLVAVLSAHGVTFSENYLATAKKRAGGPVLLGGKAAGITATELPFTARGILEGFNFTMTGNVSSQYISGMLFALALIGQRTGKVTGLSLTTKLESSAYVKLTIAILAHFGVTVKHTDSRWVLVGGQRFVSPGEFCIEGDWSNAAVFFALKTINPAIDIKGLRNDSLQGDRAIVDYARQWHSAGEHVPTANAKHENVREKQTIDVRDIPDLFPILAILAAAPNAASPRVTVFTGTDRLRFKESNRLSVTVELLAQFGVNCRMQQENCTIERLDKPCLVPQVSLDGKSDHRMVMASLLAAHLFGTRVVIEGAEAITKSYPTFFEDYRNLGGSAQEF